MKVESVDNWVVHLEKKWKSILLTSGSQSDKESGFYAILNNPPVVLEKGKRRALKLDARDAPTAHRGSRPWGKGGQTELSKKRSAPASKGLKMIKGQIKLFQGEPNYLLKTLKGCSISDRILFCVTFIFVIFASAGRFRSSDKIRHGRVRDCPDLTFLIKNLQPQFLWLKKLSQKTFFCKIW